MFNDKVLLKKLFPPTTLDDLNDFTWVFKTPKSHDILKSYIANMQMDVDTKDDYHGEPSFDLK